MKHTPNRRNKKEEGKDVEESLGLGHISIHGSGSRCKDKSQNYDVVTKMGKRIEKCKFKK